MFVIDMKKGFYTSFFINIGLAVLLIIMTILYFTKDTALSENLGLQSLIIDEVDIDFNSDRYSYPIEIDNSIDELTLVYVPYSKDANVKIEGNENLRVGYNQIKIIVEEDNALSKTYYLDVEKLSKDNNL